ncbi:MAG: 30S ribosomal protein S19e [Hadesarchaea archaeon]|jgi:small subunit ribosomal protein S19e|nr:30S ribosomal protein S19e [Hadesarchaea archaeon]TDA32947.1 MAG: 30S ribosomal protein S19e [Hadesarchaea archaeon]
MSVREVPPHLLIARTAEELKKLEEVKPPEWSRYVKTGVHKERPPEQPDWWYIRGASLLRRIYLEGPVGVSRLRVRYGGRKKRGSAPEHFRRGGGKILRTLLQQLERAGLVEKKDRKGRKVTRKGAEFLERLAEGLKGG